MPGQYVGDGRPIDLKRAQHFDWGEVRFTLVDSGGRFARLRAVSQNGQSLHLEELLAGEFVLTMAPPSRHNGP